MLWPSPAVLGCACSAAQPAQVAQPARPQSVSTRPISKPTVLVQVNYHSGLLVNINSLIVKTRLANTRYRFDGRCVEVWIV